jgi:hypothetical protein
MCCGLWMMNYSRCGVNSIKERESGLYGRSLEEYIFAMHGIDVIWKPKESGEEPPF